MKKTILLLALLLGASTISAQSIQCTGIALSTGVQCEKKVALKHNRTRCHHHIGIDYTTQKDIDFNHREKKDTENSFSIIEYIEDSPMPILFILGVPTLILFIMFGLLRVAQYVEDKTNLDAGWVFCGLMLFVCSLPVILPMIFK